MYDLIVIGSGPAGLSAAVYGIRAGFKTLVIEKNPMSGGQVLNTYEVDNYLGMPGMNGFDMGMAFREHADRLGAEFAEADVKEVEDCREIKKVKTTAGDFEARAVIIAAGATYRKLGVPGEEELAGRGISYCATCDGAFFRKRTVAVIGGGDVAVEDAIFLARECKKVYLVHRRDELRAAKSLQKRLFELENVEFVWDSVVKRIQGEEVVTGILVENKKTKEERVIGLDGIFVAVGIQPNSALFKGLVKMDEGGYLEAGEDCVTSAEGIFAVGDVRTKKLRQIVTAVADGANAVASAQEYFLR